MQRYGCIGSLVDELNLPHIEKIPRSQLRHQIHGMISDYVISERLPLNARELSEFVDEVMDELIGLGPIEPILRDPTVTDILINTHECVYVERGGQLEPVPVRFKDEAHVLRIVNKIVGAVGRRVDESSPMVDARLLDGSRINVAVRPIAIDGPLGLHPQVCETGSRNGDFGQKRHAQSRRWGRCWRRPCGRDSRFSSPAAPAPAKQHF